MKPEQPSPVTSQPALRDMTASPAPRQSIGALPRRQPVLPRDEEEAKAQDAFSADGVGISGDPDLLAAADSVLPSGDSPPLAEAEEAATANASGAANSAASAAAAARSAALRSWRPV